MITRFQLITVTGFLVFVGVFAPSWDTASAMEGRSPDQMESPSEEPPTNIVKVRQPDGTHRWQSEDSASGETFNALSGGGRREASVNALFIEHAVVNDPLFDDQWNFDQIGVPFAWDIATGAGVIVAVLDSGVAVGPDLACRTFVSPYSALNGLESMDAVQDLRGHGTHVIGTIAQCTDNGQGLAGIARGATVMPVKVLDDTGSGTSESVANGIIHAVANGADVINLSLGFGCDNDGWPACANHAVDAEIEAAVAAGVVVVASAGNDSAAGIGYPAIHPLVIAVGASDGSGLNAPYSAGGPALDVLAPGGNTSRNELIYQETVPGDGSLSFGYVGQTGTSMAAPHVSGTVAVMLESNPSLTPLGVRCNLIDTAADVGPQGWDTFTGWGEIRSGAASAHRGESFTDVESEWFEPNLSTLVDEGVVDGFGDCTFRPQGAVTRAQSVKLLVTALDEALNTDVSQVFTDVPTTDWSAAYAQRAYELGWVTGYEDGTFRPGDPVTRIQLAVIATRAMGLEPIEASEPAFSDVSIEDWFHPRLAAAKIEGVIHGHADGSFGPHAPVTRAQAITIIYNILHPDGDV